MFDSDKMRLLKKTSAKLVYIASAEVAKKILGAKEHCERTLYIHVDRAYGNVDVYEENDSDKRVKISQSAEEDIQAFAEKDR